MKNKDKNIDRENIIFKGITLGDESSFRIFFDNYYQRFVSFTADLTEDTDEAEEIVAESMCSIWENRKGFQSFKAIKTYAYSTLKNKALNVIKHRKAIDRHKDYVKHTYNSKYFSNKLIEEEVHGMLYQAIESLPSECRRVFILNEIEGITLKDIAEDLQLSINTIKTHKLRATKFLRERLKKLLIFLPFLILVVQALIKNF